MSDLLSRRRKTPWIQQWSRPILAAIAVLGMLNTGYITLTKLSETAAACPTEGCDTVLASPYATVFGLPLSLFGLLAYTAMAGFALAPFVVKPEQNRPLRTKLENLTWLLLFVGATAMLVFSGYLMSIMFTKFVAPLGMQGLCLFCVASALFALALFVITLLGRSWEDLGQLLFVGTIVAIATLVTTLGIYAPIDGRQPDSTAQTSSGQPGYAIQNTSGQAEIALARHLKQIGAKMYGAYWCPHCHDQKELFGKEAAAIFNYVECAPDGQNSQTEVCQTAAPKIEEQTKQPFAFPTWEINGRYYRGIRSLEELATASGYTGPTNFTQR